MNTAAVIGFIIVLLIARMLRQLVMMSDTHSMHMAAGAQDKAEQVNTIQIILFSCHSFFSPLLFDLFQGLSKFHDRTPSRSCFGGLEVSVLASGTRVRVFFG